MNTVNWKDLVTEHLERYSETWEDIVSSSIRANTWNDDNPDDNTQEGSFTREFDPDYGSINGDHFIIWTPTRVVFPHGYDGSETVQSVSRHPSEEVVYHE